VEFSRVATRSLWLEGQVHAVQTHQGGTAMDPRNAEFTKKLFTVNRNCELVCDLKVASYGSSSPELMNKCKMMT